MDRKAGLRLRVLSRSGEPFADREEAGRLLADELTEYRGRRAVVLGIPRGGVIVAHVLARGLASELDVVLARKLRTPGQEELAMGAVAENGQVYLNPEVAGLPGIAEAYIEQEKTRQMAEIARRSKMIRRIRPRIPLRGRTVIITDDGVATGSTFEAALRALRLEQPEKLVAAIPVGPEDTVRRLARDADETLCLRTPQLFAAVGQFYRQFRPVEDEDVLRVLGEEARVG